MKTIYLSILGLGITVQTMNAQLTLLQNFHEPVAGTSSRQYYDSVGTVPKSSGTAQLWDFSTFVQDNTVDTYTYVAASSVPSASMFPGATLAQDFGGSSHTFYKSSTNMFEMLGEYSTSGNSKTTYSNTLMMYSWPIAYNSSYTDSYSGNMTGTAFAASISGDLSASAPGAGSLILPGGLMLSNVLQMKGTQTMTIMITSPTPTTIIGTSIYYEYYHTSQRYPMVTVSYNKFGTTTSGEITVNKLVAVGLTDYNVDADFSIFPNPAQSNFHVNFKNLKEENCQLEISNISGQVVRNIDLGSQSNIATEVDITALESGVYFVKTTLGSVQSTRKLIVQ